MSWSEYLNMFTKFINFHPILIVLVIFLLSFGESLVFISLLLPATIILISISGLIEKNYVVFLKMWLAATSGAFCGDWFSYWFGFHYKDNVRNIWPISRYLILLDKGYYFFKHWGVWSIIIGRFFGPLRAIIPLIAGICSMSKYHFQLANLFSAMIWAFSILISGTYGLRWFINWIK